MTGPLELADHAVTVEKVIHRQPDTGFTVLEVMPEDGSFPFVAVGVIPLEVTIGEPLLVVGRFENHPRFGRRFRLTAVQPRVPATERGIHRYLASGRIPGIGPKLAERLVACFGTETIRVLEQEPERVAEVPGLGPKKQALLRETFSQGREQREAIVFLQGLGLGPRVSMEIWRCLGREVVQRVQEDPYALCDLVTGVGFITADKMAAANGILGDHPARVRGALRHALRTALDQGHMCLEAEELVQRTGLLLGISHEALQTGIDDEIGSGRLRAVVPAVPEFEPEEPPLIYLPVLLETEREAVKRLLELIAAPRPPAPRAHVVVAGEGVLLTEEQEAAVQLLLASKVSLLTGGPGVGKTTVLKTVVDSFRRSGFEVALASPTGRAARRLTEATGFQAKTLHRLFGFVPGLERVVKGEILEADVLLIDEASMLDLPLFLRVLRNVRENVVLVLVGDPDQLPSVGPGSLLGDLIKSRRLPTARLTEIFRQGQGSTIVENAHRIQTGTMPRLEALASTSDFFFMQRDTSTEGAALIEELFMERLPRHYGVDPRTDIQILSPMHRGPAGVNALNARIQSALNGSAPGMQIGSRTIHQGDRIIQLRNDYDAGLMNGDMGLVLEVDAERRRLRARFDDRELELADAALEAIESAYALTVHKSQGGEFPVVLLPLFSDHMLMLQRNVLYTAVTRARRLMILVGTESALRRAVREDRLVRRKGGFLRLLQGNPLESLDRVAWIPQN